MNLSLYPLTV